VSIRGLWHLHSDSRLDVLDPGSLLPTTALAEGTIDGFDMSLRASRPTAAALADVYSYIMVRKQIYIDEELEHGLKALAARTGEPEAAHVRAALRDYLESRVVAAGGGDPLLEIIGLVDTPRGPTDVAEEHDHYLYGVPKRR
jgi:hypothetical protein